MTNLSHKQMPSFLTIKQLASKYPSFSESSLRYLIFNSKENKLDKAIYRVGKKILIKEELFFLWIEEQNEKGI